MLENSVLFETYAIFGRWIRKTLRRPTFLFFSLVQPIVWFLLFTQAFQRIADVPGFSQVSGTTSYLTYFSGAVILQTVIASAMQSGMGMVQDMESGYLDKLRVAPISRFSILTGKVMSDGVRILMQVAIIMALGYALGVTVVTGVGGLALLLLIAAAFGVAWSGISIFIALTTKNSEATLMISLLTTFPLLFLSTAVMPKPFLPNWVQTVATYNPLSYVADGFHSLIIQGFDWTTLGQSFLVIGLVGIVTLAATTAMFRRAVVH